MSGMQIQNTIQPRWSVLDFGVLSCLLPPHVDSVASIQAIHRSLLSVATTGSDGQKYVTCAAAAGVLQLPAAECQLLLDTLAAVAANQQQPGSTPADGVLVHSLPLFLMAQLYEREAGRAAFGLETPEGVAGFAAPGAAGGSRLQLQGHGSSSLSAAARSHGSQRARGYAAFLQRHHKALLELVADDQASQQLQQPEEGTSPAAAAADASLTGLASSSSIGGAHVQLTAAEVDRLSFLIEPAPDVSSSSGSSGGGCSGSRQQPDAPPGPGASLSSLVQGLGPSSALPMQDLLAWMNRSWLSEQQQQQNNNNRPLSQPGAAQSSPAEAGASADSVPMQTSSSDPAAAAGSPCGLAPNGSLHGSSLAAGSQQAATAADGVASTGLSLSNIRLHAPRGAVVDRQGVSGLVRGTLVLGPGDTQPGEEFAIQDCSEAHVYLLAPVRLARITNCSDCTICIGAVSSLLRIEGCERLQVTAAARQVVVLSCHSCCLHLGTPRQPALLGDCRFVKLAPFNCRYETITDHLATAGLDPNGPSRWSQPLLLGSAAAGSSSSSGGLASGELGRTGSDLAAQLRRPGCSTPSSPHTHSSGGAERRGAGAAMQSAVLLLEPADFLPLVVPFRGTVGPLAGGAAHPASTQWQPGCHGRQQGPLPPLPFPLPPEYDAALQQHYCVVEQLRVRIRGSGLDEQRRSNLQAVIQSHFREWLHSSGAIRQVYDLSKLEGDEMQHDSM